MQFSIWIDFNPPSSCMFCAKFSWKWPNCFGIRKYESLLVDAWTSDNSDKLKTTFLTKQLFLESLIIENSYFAKDKTVNRIIQNNIDEYLQLCDDVYLILRVVVHHHFPPNI